MSSLPNTLSPPIDFQSSVQSLLSFLFSREKTRPTKNRSPDRTAAEPLFELVEHAGNDRAEVERFISQRFSESFGSRVESFMPRLFSLRSEDGAIHGAFGLRSANRRLFLEQYLDTPIDKAIAARTGNKVERRVVVEVGHFSGTFPGAVRAMICLLTERLHHEGFEWVTFTGTTHLRNAFHRMGLSPIDMQAAEIERLPKEEHAVWGHYYEHAPRVLVGNIGEGYRALSARAAQPATRIGRAA